MVPDHPKLSLDSLHEKDDSPVKGLVHRYPDRALFLREFPARPVKNLRQSLNVVVADGLFLFTYSNIGLSHILHVLYPVVCGRSGHRHRNKGILEADPQALGGGLCVH